MTRFFFAPTTPRASTISFSLLCALIIVLSVPLHTSAATLKVDDDLVQCPTAAYATIQAAVLAAAAGDTIKVCPGTYGGQVVINKSLKIKGKAPKAKTCNTLVAPDSTLHSIYQAPAAVGLAGIGIDVHAANVTIDSLVVTLAGETGIRTDPSVSKFTLKKSVLIANSDGIQFHSSGATKGSDKSSVKSNCFYQNTLGGIRTRYGLDDATISKNFFFGTVAAAAIIVDQEPGITNDHLTVTGNKSQGDSTFAVILGTRDSVFSKNTVNQTGGTAIFVGGNNVNLEIIGNTVTNAGTRGIRFNTAAFPASPNVASTGVQVSKNVIDNAGRHGIVADSAAGESTLVLSRIEKNTVTNSGQSGIGDGIRIEDSQPGANGGNTIQENTISGSFNHDCHDVTAGTGTAGTANTWSGDTATTQNIANLCFTGAANGTAD